MNSQMILIGDMHSKRTLYFKKAAQHLNVPVQVLPYCYRGHFSIEAENILKKQRKRSEKTFLQSQKKPENTMLLCKIDPPSYSFMGKNQYRIDSMHKTASTYFNWLTALPEPSENLQYLNTPASIALLLDKYRCKQKLIDAGLAVTPLLEADIPDYHTLQQFMKDRRCCSVFIKPKLASGAAGILAYQWHPGTGQERLYTSACPDYVKETIMNTKKLFCYRDSEIIQKIFSHILPLGTIAEHWISKAEYQNRKYDLRVLYQFGKIAFITVRQSRGPITNLHLNNNPLPSEHPGLLPKCLNITEKQFADMEQLCHQAVSAFDGLRMAGIDILFEKNSQKPYIIEMNGQGDLLYQDIYTENRIYREQAEMALKNIFIKEI